MQRHQVTSGEVTLAVREYGESEAPTLVAVHGFPDSQRVWARLAERVVPQLRVLTYDVRGAGETSAPRPRAAYRTERLVDDFVAVIDALAPDAPVHLLGHDWGSIQLWDVVNAEQDDPRLSGRITSYTSIGGPSLDHAAFFRRRAPAGQRLGQALRSWYIYAFHLPVLPELALRHVGKRVLGAERARNAANGLQLYRANILRRLRHPRPVYTRVPVQVVVPLRDRYVNPAVLRGLEDYVEHLHLVEIDADHWVPRTHPDELARLVTDWALRR